MSKEAFKKPIEKAGQLLRIIGTIFSIFGVVWFVLAVTISNYTQYPSGFWLATATAAAGVVMLAASLGFHVRQVYIDHR